MTENTGREQLNESISALVDGYSSEIELRRIMKATETDDGAREVWSRYQAISQTMQGEAPASLGIDLSDAVRDAIDSEPEIKKNWLQNLARTAIAASVAGAVVLTAQMTSQQVVPDGAQMANNANAPQAVSPATLSLPAGFQAPSVAARTVSSEPVRSVSSLQERSAASVASPQIVLKSAKVPSRDIQLHIQEIMTLHANQAALNSNRGMLPYARVPAPVSE